MPQSELRDISIRDGKWIFKKQQVQVLAKRLSHVMPEIAIQLYDCGSVLAFRQLPDGSLRLCRPRGARKNWFCKKRFCPICSWRRLLLWEWKFLSVVDRLEHDFPAEQYVWLMGTLTVRSPHLEDLRDALRDMSSAYTRLTKRYIDYRSGREYGNLAWPFLGSVRCTEITRGRIPGRCHPHIHWFGVTTRDVYEQSAWSSPNNYRFLSEQWARATKVDYSPQVEVHLLQQRHGEQHLTTERPHLVSAVLETIKYFCKMPDLLMKDEDDLLSQHFSDRPFEMNDFTPQVINAMRGMRFIQRAGVLRQYVPCEPEDLIYGDDRTMNTGTSKFPYIEFQWQPRDGYIQRDRIVD